MRGGEQPPREGWGETQLTLGFHAAAAAAAARSLWGSVTAVQAQGAGYSPKHRELSAG